RFSDALRQPLALFLAVALHWLGGLQGRLALQAFAGLEGAVEEAHIALPIDVGDHSTPRCEPNACASSMSSVICRTVILLVRCPSKTMPPSIPIAIRVSRRRP